MRGVSFLKSSPGKSNTLSNTLLAKRGGKMWKDKAAAAAKI